MNGAIVEFSDNFISSSAARLSTKNAWALYARRRWPQNTVKCVMAEWSLTDGEARGLVYAQASQPTIDKILDHPRGGFGLGLLILQIRMQTGLRAWINSERERSADEARRAQADAAAFDQMARRLPAVLGVGTSGADRMGERQDGRSGAVRSVSGSQPDREA